LRAGQDAAVLLSWFVTTTPGGDPENGPGGTTAARPAGAVKCRCGAPGGERADRKARERLRTVFRRVDRKIRQGRFASAQRLPALHPLWGNGKRDGRTNLGFTRDWKIWIPRSAKADLGAPA